MAELKEVEYVKRFGGWSKKKIKDYLEREGKRIKKEMEEHRKEKEEYRKAYKKAYKKAKITALKKKARKTAKYEAKYSRMERIGKKVEDVAKAGRKMYGKDTKGGVFDAIGTPFPDKGKPVDVIGTLDGIYPTDDKKKKRRDGIFS